MNRKRLSLGATAAAFLLALLLYQTANPWPLRAANALFLGGLPCLVWGCLRLVWRLGGFDLLAYANERVMRGGRRKSKSELLAEADEAPGPSQSYFEYTTARKADSLLSAPLILGGGCMALSFVITLIFS